MTEAARTSRAGSGSKGWVQCLDRRPLARMRLFCFPFAGGGAGVFRKWPAYLPRSLEAHAIQFPGRENRFGERCAQDMDEAVAAVLAELQPLMDLPCAFFGHSLGALTAYEVASAVEAAGLGRPLRLIVSGRRAPHRHRAGRFHALPDQDLIAELMRLNGTSPQVFADPEMRALFLPMLRSDYRILETYNHRRAAPLAMPITACSGVEDTEVSPQEMRAWADLTSGGFGYLPFPGGHFYLNPLARELAESISHILTQSEA